MDGCEGICVRVMNEIISRQETILEGVSDC